jgi:hypothetical protein
MRASWQIAFTLLDRPDVLFTEETEAGVGADL